MPRVVAVLNPRAAGGRTGRRRAVIEAWFAAHVPDAVVRVTEARGHATELAREAVSAGAQMVVAVGGDGTANEVLTGLVDDRGELRDAGAVLGLYGAGTGGDFLRHLQRAEGDLQRARGEGAARTDLQREPLWLARGEVRAVDYAIATVHAPGGQAIVRPFLNVASVGASALAVARIEGLKHRSPAWLAYAAGSLRAVAQLRAWTVGGVSDRRRREPEPITLIAIGNGSTFGNGLIVAPGAACDDGWLDVMWARELPRWQALVLLARMRSGSHVEHPRVETWRAREVALDCPDELPAQVELDGELVGTLPLRVELRVGRLALCGPS